MFAPFEKPTATKWEPSRPCCFNLVVQSPPVGVPRVVAAFELEAGAPSPAAILLLAQTPEKQDLLGT